MSRQQRKRQTDQQILTEWIGHGQRVLDLGCGRGILLEHLMRVHAVQAIGVDTDFAKIQSCVRRGVPVYHGDADSLLREFPDGFMDWVIISRTLQELNRPGDIIRESLRVARNVAVGFVNHGFWLNRWAMLRTGARPVNEVFPQTWETSAPINPITVKGFRAFLDGAGIRVRSAVFLQGDWVTPVPCWPNLLAGYALFHLTAG